MKITIKANNTVLQDLYLKSDNYPPSSVKPIHVVVKWHVVEVLDTIVICEDKSTKIRRAFPINSLISVSNGKYKVR